MTKLVVFVGGLVVGGAIGAVTTYILYARKAEEKALAFYAEQVAIFRKHEQDKKIIPLEEDKPVKFTVKEEDRKAAVDAPSSPSEGLKFKRDKNMYTSYSRLTEAYSANMGPSEDDIQPLEVITEDDEPEKVSYLLKTYESVKLICYPDENVIENDMGDEDLGDFDDFDDRDGVYIFNAVDNFGFSIADTIMCAHVGDAVTGDDVDPLYIVDHNKELIYCIDYSWGPSRKSRLAGAD